MKVQLADMSENVSLLTPLYSGYQVTMSSANEQ